jgi:hypothetical protein
VGCPCKASTCGGWLLSARYKRRLASCETLHLQSSTHHERHKNEEKCPESLALFLFRNSRNGQRCHISTLTGQGAHSVLIVACRAWWWGDGEFWEYRKGLASETGATR